jgi:hypothetical protein
LVSSSGIAPSQRYSEIGFRQSTLGSSGPTTTAISPSGSRFGSIGNAEAPGLTSEVRTGSSFPGGIPGVGTSIGMSSPGEILGLGTGISSSSRMEGLNKSYVNTLEGGGSRLDLSRARMSAASLSRWRIWWSLKPMNFSSSYLTSCRYAAMRESRQFDSIMT